MTDWIGGLLHRNQSTPINGLSSAAVFLDKNIRVDLKERALSCGHLSYWIAASCYSEETRDWVELAFVHESDLDGLVRLLQEAQAYVREI